MNYEDTLKELNEILNNMESEEIKLDEMVEEYKKAINLYNELKNYLENYKSEIKKVTEEGLQDFDVSETEWNKRK